MRMDRAEAMGQVTIEYFLLFAAIALVTVLGLTQFDEQVGKTLRHFFTSATRCVSTTATATDACQPKPKLTP